MRTMTNRAMTTTTTMTDTEKAYESMLEFQILEKWVDGLLVDLRDRPDEYRSRPEFMDVIISDLEFTLEMVRDLEAAMWKLVTPPGDEHDERSREEVPAGVADL